jgi:hypothetical protein
MVMKAKGRFDTPTIPWTEDDFLREYKKIDEFQQEVMQLVIILEHTTFSAEELSLPMKLYGSSARPHRPDHQNQADPDSRPTSDQKAPETPDETRE